MFHSIITKKRDIWYKSKDCAVNGIINYIQKQNKLRDAQIEAIKTYLYLKIACDNKPLWRLFYEGTFNSLELDTLKISHNLRKYLKANPQALSLYQYALYNNKQNLIQCIEKEYNGIDYKSFFMKLFYEVDYTDYLFSLPMGAGKTYLMASFIYLDLYFAKNEIKNKNFAHNFIILVPSGLKTSILPSLKTIQTFDPSWIVPEPSASNLKRLIKFEILNESKTDKKSNKIRNPNVAKISSYQPYSNMFGIVLITNAEKVILDKIDKEPTLYKDATSEEKLSWIEANELRNTISKIPNLSIFIDEVHHAAKDNIKLRQVVNEWNKNGSINMAAGFSGTPYLKNKEKIQLNDIIIEYKEISNIVYYYPLIKGIGNFLKTPTVKISSSSNRLEIVESGLREFLENDTKYKNNLGSKIAIYCGNIENLENIIYPKVCEILLEYKINHNEAVLKFYKGNIYYPEPKDAQYIFDNLDSPLSKIKVILLVQIGKEGWDCKSLSAVILSQEGDCPTNMTLQTSCRCLRQVEKNKDEKALIYLNETNANKLSMQLKAEQQISIEEFQKGAQKEQIQINRYDRTKQLNLPFIDFYQIKLEYESVLNRKSNPKEDLSKLDCIENEQTLIIEKDFKDNIINQNIEEYIQKEEYANFNQWLYKIQKNSFYTIKLKELKTYKDELKNIFNNITYAKNEKLYFDDKYNKTEIESLIRKAFSDKRDFNIKKEILPQSAELLLVERLISPLFVESKEERRFIPEQKEVKSIIDEDNGKLGRELTKKELQAIEMLKQTGNEDVISLMQSKTKKHPHRDKTYHYLPYRTDSDFEISIFNQILTLRDFNDFGLEIYYNGESNLTNFRIFTYKDNISLGYYTPDFLIIKRIKNKIDKILILETKGAVFSKNFEDKKNFMQEFININNKEYGYNRFEFLYIEDSNEKAIIEIDKKLKDFFS